MTEGTLRWFNEETGYGLIRPEGGGRDPFVRSTDVAIGGVEPLEEGAGVSYEVKRGNGRRATNVSRRHRYSWWDDSLQRHEGKEARNEYYNMLDDGEVS